MLFARYKSLRIKLNNGKKESLWIFFKTTIYLVYFYIEGNSNISIIKYTKNKKHRSLYQRGKYSKWAIPTYVLTCETPSHSSRWWECPSAFSTAILKQLFHSESFHILLFSVVCYNWLCEHSYWLLHHLKSRREIRRWTLGHIFWSNT